jgi:hypothetical protein
VLDIEVWVTIVITILGSELVVAGVIPDRQEQRRILEVQTHKA